MAKKTITFLNYFCESFSKKKLSKRLKLYLNRMIYFFLLFYIFFKYILLCHILFLYIIIYKITKKIKIYDRKRAFQKKNKKT